MNITSAAIGAALAATFLASAGHAQLAKQAIDREKKERQEQTGAPEGGATIMVGDRKLTISAAAVKQVQELQAAVQANDIANIPAKLAAAKAAATTADERYVVAKLQLQAALASKDETTISAAAEEVLATGLAPQEEALILLRTIANAHIAAKRNQQATATLQRILDLDPGNSEAVKALEALTLQSASPAEVVAAIEKKIAASRAGGAKPPESLYKQAVATAYNARLPAARELSREWVKAYPTKEAWQSALAIYQNFARLDDDSRTLDYLRLKSTVGVMNSNDVYAYGEIAVRRGYSGEAKAVLEAAFAANLADKSDARFRKLYALASQRSAGDREGLPGAPPAEATARHTMNLGDAYYGYGDYAKAVEFYRAALSRTGADSNLINLHIGMALARQGDSAGATAALKSVGGEYAELAQYWMLYAATRS